MIPGRLHARNLGHACAQLSVQLQVFLSYAGNTETRLYQMASGPSQPFSQLRICQQRRQRARHICSITDADQETGLVLGQNVAIASIIGSQARPTEH
jgi:hypothetical protein